SLEIRTAVRTLAAPPRVLQRWIVVWSKVPVEPGTVPLALSDGQLWVAHGSNLAQIEVPDSQHMAKTSVPTRMVRVSLAEIPRSIAARVKRVQEDRQLAAPRTVGRGRIVAVLHRREIILGLAGALIPVMQPMMQSAARSQAT